jgi:predicted MPP superfamily phosphohydrolase
MGKLNKPFEPITTLIIIYFALVAVSIALYALIQIFFKADTSTASSLLGWTATMFATIAVLYIYNNWREQESTKLLSDLSNKCMDRIDLLIRTNDKLGSNVISILNGNTNNSNELYEDFKIQCSELHNLLLKIDAGLNDNELNSLIMNYINKIENIKSIVNNTFYAFDNLEDDIKSSFSLQINNLASSLFSNLNLIKNELKPCLFFDKST